MNAPGRAAHLAQRSRLGRFELLRVLGKGAQATVWLARDDRLHREVALKLLTPGAQGVALDVWLHEARAVSRLKHPHVVPLFEADEVEGQPCLVFEFVDGATLAQRLKGRGALPVPEAVRLLLEVLDALSEAHAQGIVHRDLKPSNVLVGADGRARVMDFGIAAMAAAAGPAGQGAAHRVVGTPGYMSPEAAAGLAPTPAMDVFSAGLLLAELLTGQALLQGTDPWELVRLVRDEELLLPPALLPDESLRELVQRALSRQAGQRFADAASMRRALLAWQESQHASSAASDSSTLDFLLRRMRHKSDFPALSAAITRVQRVAASEHETLDSLAQEILKDVALTQKLLRLVNTAHFSQAASGGVSTVSRAVALVGFAGIRNMALALVMLEHMEDKAHAHALRDEFLRSLLAAHLAGQLCRSAREAEEAFIGALFQNLGRTLTRFYLAEEASRIDALLQPSGLPGEKRASPDESSASAQVLGISFEQLGLCVAEVWGLPDALRQAMRRPAGEPPVRSLDRLADRVRWSARLGHDAADAVLSSEPAQLPTRLKELAERYAPALGITVESLGLALQTAREGLAQLVQAAALPLPRGSAARRLLPRPMAASAATGSAADDGLQSHALQATREPAAAAEPEGALARRREASADMLAAGIQDITQSMIEDGCRLTEVLRMVLETMLRALQLRHVVLALRDPKTECLLGRFGLGDGASEAASVIRVPLKLGAGAQADLFTAVCLKGADTLISDARAANIVSRLPAWHREQVRSASFLVLPLMSKGAPFGFIYADLGKPGALDLDERELNLLRTLRNQAVMAFRQER
ncbi:MAG: HDOD domain-containing protein [Rubrivivax sp.]|nr:HDOD domain-containing protein [Rubrivivax sp.]